jgi:hypothetical protein
MIIRALLLCEYNGVVRPAIHDSRQAQRDTSSSGLFYEVAETKEQIIVTDEPGTDIYSKLMLALVDRFNGVIQAGNIYGYSPWESKTKSRVKSLIHSH